MNEEKAQELAELQQAFEAGHISQAAYQAAVAGIKAQQASQAEQSGGGSIAQGEGNVAAGEQGVAVGGNVQGDVIVVADPARFWATWGQADPPADLTQATEDYLTHVIDRYRYLDFKGMGVADRIPLRLPLVEMYVPLKARIEMPDGETWARELRLAGRQVSKAEAAMMGERLSEPQPVLTLLQQYNGLIILGDPGAGKTTFLKYLALCLAGQTGIDLGLGLRLPILLPLSAYANALAEQDVPLDHFIDQYYRERGSHWPIRALVTEALDRGAALLLLDGLDEVRQTALRQVVVERVVDFFTFRQRQGNKFILTSRIVGYREVRPVAEGLRECTLVDFGEEEIAAFVNKWTTALERAMHGHIDQAQIEADAEAKALLTAIQTTPGVQTLAANPLLLTILALMKRQGVDLPERRVELYQKYVETLLKTWNLARGLGRPSREGLDVVETLRVLAPLSLWMQETSPGVGLVKQGPLRRKLVEICRRRKLPNPEQQANQFLADVREYAGLLVERGSGEYGFIHLTFQEYLAGVAIALQGQQAPKKVVQALAAHLPEITWHEVSQLTIGYMGIVQQLDAVAGQVVRQLSRHSLAGLLLAGEAVVDAGRGGVDPQTREQIRRLLVKMMIDDRQVPVKQRAAAGDVLARLGDPRQGVGVKLAPTPSLQPASAGGGSQASPPSVPPEGGLLLPNIEWCTIPASPFIMGDGNEAHEVTLPSYQISRYPVTNAQFDAFVQAGGYENPTFWGEAQAEGYWSTQGFTEWLDDTLRQRPYDFGHPFVLSNHPVVGVSWYEALAFCRWLSEQRQQPIRLPSEREWEKAARGTNGRTYPWPGDEDPNRANYEDTGLAMSNAVGCFPGGASVYGCEEMVGNVWEWCLTKWEDRYENYQDDNTLEGRSGRVLRGGYFGSDRTSVRCGARSWCSPDLRGWSYGFRLVQSPFTSDR